MEAPEGCPQQVYTIMKEVSLLLMPVPGTILYGTVFLTPKKFAILISKAMNTVRIRGAFLDPIFLHLFILNF